MFNIASIIDWSLCGCGCWLLFFNIKKGDKSILAELQKLRKLKIEEDQKQKKAFQNMFAKMSVDNS